MAYSKRTWQTGDLVTAAKLNHMEQGIEDNDTAVATKVPLTRTVQGKELSADVTLDAGDIPFDASATYDSGTVGNLIKGFRGLFWCTYGTTKYGEVIQAVSSGLLPVVRLEASDLVSAGIVITDGCAYVAVYTGYILSGDATPTGTTVSTAIFASVQDTTKFFAYFKLENDHSTTPATVTNSWNIRKVSAFDYKTGYNTTTKALYNTWGYNGTTSNIITAADLKDDMELSAEDIAYDESETYSSGTLGKTVSDIKRLFWCKSPYIQIGTLTTYDEIIAAYGKGWLPVVKATSDSCAVFTGTGIGYKSNPSRTVYTAYFYCFRGNEAIYASCEKSVNNSTQEVINPGNWTVETSKDINSKTYYNSTTKKFYRTEGSSTVDIVTAADLRTDMGINNVASLAYEVVT